MGGLCDVWVMVFSSVVEWEGLDEEGDLGEKKMGFGRGVSWIPTLTRSTTLTGYTCYSNETHSNECVLP